MATNNDNSQYNQDELHAPAWLNKEFFEMVLKQHEGCDRLEVEKYEITPGTGKSDHYASVIFRAKVSYDIKYTDDYMRKSISLIIKTAPEQEGMKMELLREFTLFKTEILMYAEILPKINELLKAAGNEAQFYAKMIYGSMTPRQCIVFEDLVVKGYAVIPNRFSSMEEVNLAISNLARMHAASYKLVQENNAEIPKLNSPLTKKALEKIGFMQEGTTFFKQLLAEEDDLRKYIPYIEKVEKGILDEIADCFNPDELRKRSKLLVLNHGDFHARNIMVQYTDNVLKNVVLIDFQACFYGSAVLDLMYGQTLLLNPEMRTNRRDEAFSKYIEIFQDTLKKINFAGKIPTKADFEEEWKRFRRWELFLLINYLVLNYTVMENKIAVSDVMENPEVRKKMWQEKKIIGEVRVQLPRMIQQGYFD